MSQKKNILFVAILMWIVIVPGVCFAQDRAGSVIAVPLPQIKSTQKSDEWIGQFVQDSLTSNLARYSGMTVVDRANENLVVAEQKLSENERYNDENAIEIGKMTNAHYVLAGSIHVLSKNYSMNFRVNDIETNEIKASFQKNYTLGQIESGEAVQEISKEIMLGLGIELDATAIAALDKTSDKAIVVNQNLAKGAAAEKNEDFITALQYFAKVQEADPTKTEAKESIQNIFGGNISTQGLKAQIEYQKNMINRWNKIFSDLYKYMYSNDLFIVVYDFSNMKTKIKYNYRNEPYVEFSIFPGIKIVQNRRSLLVMKTVLDEWSKIKSNQENYEWIKQVKGRGNNYNWNPFGSGGESLRIYVSVYDDYNDKIDDKETYADTGFRYYNFGQENVVLAQQKYYDNQKFCKFSFSVQEDKITDNIDIKITKVFINLVTGNSGNDPEIHPRIFTVQEYEEWLAAGCL